MRICGLMAASRSKLGSALCRPTTTIDLRLRGLSPRLSRTIAACFCGALVCAVDDSCGVNGDGEDGGGGCKPSTAFRARASENERAIEVAVANMARLYGEGGTQATPGMAARIFNCEGLGEEHDFWPVFREALKARGPLGIDTLPLAFWKWSDWEQTVRLLETEGYFSCGSNGCADEFFPRAVFLNNASDHPLGGLELHGFRDRLDIVKILQSELLENMFGVVKDWGPNQLNGFLACPIGFLLVQYCVFVVHRVRSPDLDMVGRRINWESMLNAFGYILGVPSYAMDHLESSDWGIDAFDIAVNLVPDFGGYYKSYKDFKRLNPIPPPRLEPWWIDATSLASIRDHGVRAFATNRQSMDFVLGTGSPPRTDEVVHRNFQVAMIGEHGATNIDHLSTLTKALQHLVASISENEFAPERAADGSAQVSMEVGNYFTYLWNLKGTSEGESLTASLRVSWESFWGEPLTESQGRSTSASPRWTVAKAVSALREWAGRDSFLQSSDLWVCCEPLWLCVLLHAAHSAAPLLVRVSMCLLHAFEHVFGAPELQAFWPHVRSFGEALTPRGGLSAAARISAEMLAFQTGIRAPYVPALSVHIMDRAAYAPSKADILMFRSSLPGAAPFRRAIKLFAAELGPSAPLIVEMPGGSSLSYAEIAAHRGVLMLPHVPHALRLADIYAMGSPIFVPGEPLVHKFIWPFAGPFCGRTDKEMVREVDLAAPNRSEPPYSPFDFQGKNLDAAAFHNDRRYWLQYTEWELRPHLLRFRSVRELLQMASFSKEEALSVGAKMKQEHDAMVAEALLYWQAAAIAARS